VRKEKTEGGPFLASIPKSGAPRGAGSRLVDFSPGKARVRPRCGVSSKLEKPLASKIFSDSGSRSQPIVLSAITECAPFKAANQPSRYYSWVWDTAGQRALSEREKFAPTRKHTGFRARLQPPKNRPPITSGSARGSRREADRREKQDLGEATCRTSYPQAGGRRCEFQNGNRRPDSEKHRHFLGDNYAGPMQNKTRQKQGRGHRRTAVQGPRESRLASQGAQSSG
jgi:hypothetical protein